MPVAACVPLQFFFAWSYIEGVHLCWLHTLEVGSQDCRADSCINKQLDFKNVHFQKP